MDPLRIVVADPCADSRETLAELLCLHGHEAVPVPNLQALTARLRETAADAVVTEVFRDPEGTCSVIRAAASSVRVAFYTGWSCPDDKRWAVALRCRYFVKPDGIDKLLGWLARKPETGADRFRAGGGLRAPKRPRTRELRALCVATLD